VSLYFRLNRRQTLLIISFCALLVAAFSHARRAACAADKDAQIAVSSNVVISQVYGGGGNSGSTYKNDFIELFNRGTTTVNLSGWSVQYNSATGTSSYLVTNLSGSIAPGKYYLVQEAAGGGGTTNLPAPDATGTINLSATAGRVALVNNTTALPASAAANASGIVDFVGYGSSAATFEGSAPAPAPSNTTAILRAGNGCTDTDSNSVDFSTGAPTPRNSSAAANSCGGAGATNPSGAGAANPSSGQAGSATLLTVTVTPGTNPTSTGIAVTGDLSAIGGSSAQTFYDDGTHGDVTANDNVFSFQATVANGTAPGQKTLPVTITDAQARTGTTSITYTVLSPPVAIHDIQGSGNTSPLVGQTVTTSGIVTALKSNGFFLQTPDNQIDSDPNTSEAIFVFTSSAPPAAAAVGNLVNVTGTVQEFAPASDPNSPTLTEISGNPSVTLVSTGNALPAPVTITAADTLVNDINNLEKYEAMRVRADSLTAVSPTQETIDEVNATATINGIFYAVVTNVARPFREPGIQVPDQPPSGSPSNIPRFDANPERIRLNTSTTSGQTGATPLDVTTGAVLTNVVGVLDYGGRAYTILPDPATPPTITPGITAAAPLPTPQPNELTIASFNMERFFDTTDDPSVQDVVLTPTAFNNRLNKVSLAVRNILRMPDIIGVEEMENLSTLNAVATKINNDAVAAGQTNPNYAAYLVEGNDVGGIDVGFLIKQTRIDMSSVTVTQYGKNATYINPNTNAPELLNDRPPLVLQARTLAQMGVSSSLAFTVIVNHLRSLSGLDSPTDGNRVRTKRQKQAEYLANLIQALQTNSPPPPVAPGAAAADAPYQNIIVVGDFNAYEFNDGYVDVMGTIKGTPAPADQVVLSSSDLVNPDLTDLTTLSTNQPSQKYSYSFDGNAQELDHILVNDAMLNRLTRYLVAHNDADFSGTYRNDPNRPERISDHDMPVAYFQLPAAPTADRTSIKGRVVDANGRGAAGVTLALSGAEARYAVTDGDGFYAFDDLSPNEFYVVRPSLNGSQFAPAERAIAPVRHVTDAVFSVTARDQDTNPLDSEGFFVRQQYLDFLGREPDARGFDFWTKQLIAQLAACGADAECAVRARARVSAAFFLSDEFQQTGGFVYRMSKVAWGGAPRFAEFVADRDVVRAGVVVGQDNWRAQLAANISQLADDLTQRAEFKARYAHLSNAQFVAALDANAESIWSADERAMLVRDLDAGATTRAVVLQKAATNKTLAQREFARAFVLMQYFGYLRRDPDAAPDGDWRGYEFWLAKLAAAAGDYERAEMVEAFVSAVEYRQRFGKN
jgi:predicted extracellular nuclease